MELDEMEMTLLDEGGEGGERAGRSQSTGWKVAEPVDVQTYS